MYHWIVSREESGLTLLGFIKKKLGESFSNKKIKQSIEFHQCKINGNVERFATTPLGCADQISFSFISTLSFESGRILYEDEDLLAYDKPPFIQSVDENGRGLDTLLKKARPSLIAVHRLDRDTSGVILFAKNSQMHSHIIDLFKNRQVIKTYLALVHGVPDKAAGSIEKYMGAIEKTQGSCRFGIVSKAQGLYSKTDWTLLKKGRSKALLQCRPLTGRTHQIRVHLSHLGHPILGDLHYGDYQSIHREFPRIMLHASSLSIPYPKNSGIVIESSLPADFQAALDNLS